MKSVFNLNFLFVVCLLLGFDVIVVAIPIAIFSICFVSFWLVPSFLYHIHELCLPSVVTAGSAYALLNAQNASSIQIKAMRFSSFCGRF